MEEFFGEGPYYMLARRFVPDPSNSGNITFDRPAYLSGPDIPPSIPVFTDSAAAEQYRDEQAPDDEILEVSDLRALAGFLRGLTAIGAVHVARDPYRPGYNTVTAPIDVITQGW